MLLETSQLVAWLTRRGEVETAFEIDGLLPPHLDTDSEEHRDLLSRHGVDIDVLLADYASSPRRPHAAPRGAAGDGPASRRQ